MATSNILAFEQQDDYGKNAAIYNVVGLENLDETQDTITSTDEPLIKNYMGENTRVVSDIYTQSQQTEEDIYRVQSQTELATTQGGSALIKPELVSTEAAKITRTSVKEYVVQEGDTVGEIAQRFAVSVNTILWANNLSSYSYIKPGQKLLIPPTSGVLHTVKKGDTLLAIANKYSASINEIKNFNNIGGDTLSINETLMVPGGRIVYTARPRPISTPVTVSAPAYTTPQVESSGPMYWPDTCRRITQYYRGWLHTGLDIACGFGQPIRAAEAGRVSKVSYQNYGYGYHVIIDHGSGKQTLYGHMSRIYVSAGQQIEKAEVIGLEGSTGQSTGSHLHFEVRINGSRLNPLNYIR